MYSELQTHAQSHLHPKQTHLPRSGIKLKTAGSVHAITTRPRRAVIKNKWTIKQNGIIM